MTPNYNPSKRQYLLSAEFPLLDEGMKLIAQDVKPEDLEQTYNYLIDLAKKLRESQELIRQQKTLEQKANEPSN
jgi:hypothetical protein